MKLFAILCWWDESPTWLAATVTSLKKLGVDHVIAVDGRYPLFERQKPVASRPDQVEAIHLAAYSAGMGVTIHQPNENAALDEVEKRTFAFKLLEAMAVTHEDWCVVIDADETVRRCTVDLKAQLAALPDDTHVMQLSIVEGTDHHAPPGTRTDQTAASEQIARVHPIPTEFSTNQSRCFRVLERMNTGGNHWMYNGWDREGCRVYLRNDTGRTTRQQGFIVSEQATVTEGRVEIMHRKDDRIKHRRNAKKQYYSERDQLGIESNTL